MDVGGEGRAPCQPSRGGGRRLHRRTVALPASSPTRPPGRAQLAGGSRPRKALRPPANEPGGGRRGWSARRSGLRLRRGSPSARHPGLSGPRLRGQAPDCPRRRRRRSGPQPARSGRSPAAHRMAAPDGGALRSPGRPREARGGRARARRHGLARRGGRAPAARGGCLRGLRHHRNRLAGGARPGPLRGARRAVPGAPRGAPTEAPQHRPGRRLRWGALGRATGPTAPLGRHGHTERRGAALSQGAGTPRHGARGERAAADLRRSVRRAPPKPPRVCGCEAARPAAHLSREPPRVPAARLGLARGPPSAGFRRLLGRRHGPRQDRPGARDAGRAPAGAPAARTLARRCAALRPLQLGRRSSALRAAPQGVAT